jgi:hypothetical protein
MRLSFPVIAAITLSMLGCSSGDRTPGDLPASAAPHSPPPEPMGGRWLFGSGVGNPCVMNFGAPPGQGAGEGTIAPEGGCPGNFYTSRKWTFENGSLVMRDHNSQPLGQLTQAGPGRFEGKMQNGQPVTLSR